MYYTGMLRGIRFPHRKKSPGLSVPFFFLRIRFNPRQQQHLGLNAVGKNFLFRFSTYAFFPPTRTYGSLVTVLISYRF